MRRIAHIAPFAVAALLAGCGSSSSASKSSSSSSSPGGTSSSASAAATGNNLTLSETEFKITPASPTVSSTGTITITVKNTGAITHALAVQAPGGIVRTGNIAPGSSATLKVNISKAGHYTFFCPIDGHRQSGMVGTLVVGGSSGGSGAAGASSTPTSKSGGSYGY